MSSLVGSGPCSRLHLLHMLPKLMSPRTSTILAFWLSGLANGFLYHIILSAAFDIVGAKLPKGTVLLTDVVPCLLAKLLAIPLRFDQLPYSFRITALPILSASGMLLVSLSGNQKLRLAGISLASISAGLGELSFLGLTHFYGYEGLLGYASGSGASGLIASWFYVAATIWLHFKPSIALLYSSIVPFLMVLSYFALLPKQSCTGSTDSRGYVSVPDNDIGETNDTFEDDPPRDLFPRCSSESVRRSIQQENVVETLRTAWHFSYQGLRNCKPLFFPYMLPLSLVYVSEYTINQGVLPTIIFPLSSTPFNEYRDFYPTYIAIYQIGVVIARSSILLVRVTRLYLPAILQVTNLLLMCTQSILQFVPSIWIVFALIFYEGLLGGLAFVNTFAKIIDAVAPENREFSLGATSAGDTAGVCIAGFLSIATESFLCKYSKEHGQDLCHLG